jgi:DNA polymerase-3 subunit delta
MPAVSINAYIFLGPEHGKKQDALDSVRAKIKKSSLTKPEETVFYAGETPASTIADTIQNHSLFADARIIIIKNADLIKKKDEIELVASCIKNIESDTTVILLSDELKLSTGLEDCVPKANRQIFYEMFEKEKNEWVRQFFKREGHDIDKDSIDSILEMVENNTDALKRECSRLIYFIKGSSKEQTSASFCREDIEKWLSHNREESAFTIFSRIAAGDLSKSLESLSVMLAAKQSAQGILAGLAWCFRKLGDYLSLLETGEANNSFELKKIGLSSPKAKDDYIAASRRYNMDAVEACLALTAEYDLMLRSPVAIMENILMDRYILAVIKQGN